MLHILDCGLPDEEKHKPHEKMKSAGTDCIMVFISLPAEGLMNEFGSPWGRLDMLDVLPIERVLYLDADTLASSVGTCGTPI